jgi:hypothetical protein
MTAAEFDKFVPAALCCIAKVMSCVSRGRNPCDREVRAAGFDLLEMFDRSDVLPAV